jgi:preprotein translocase subunit YajC
VIGSFKGRYIDITTGFALLYLVVSGGVMYLQIRAQRNRMGAWSR